MSDERRTTIRNIVEYQRAFMEAMDNYARAQGLLTWFREKRLADSEIREMIDAVCEDVRRVYGLSDSDHAAYKEMVLKARYGPNAGRK